MTEFDYETVEPASEYRVLTGVPYTEEPEFREYRVDGPDVVELLQGIRAPSVAEQVIRVEPVEQ